MPQIRPKLHPTIHNYMVWVTDRLVYPVSTVDPREINILCNESIFSLKSHFEKSNKIPNAASSEVQL
jgi:hypothetical protein